MHQMHQMVNGCHRAVGLDSVKKLFIDKYSLSAIEVLNQAPHLSLCLLHDGLLAQRKRRVVVYSVPRA
jgi:hypothetical protein